MFFSAVSYNQPRLNSSASWRADAITFADAYQVGYYPLAIFINTNNTIYVADRHYSRVQVWAEENNTVKTVISSNLANPYSLFVSSKGDIYTDNGYPNSRVDKWISRANISVAEMYVTDHCFGLFVDINDTLYCSLAYLHQVIAKSANSEPNTVSIVAGTGCAGFTSNMLSYPHGIFVDINFGLYVADCGNHRIQYFLPMQQNGTTVTGNGAPGTISLSCPLGVVLDADNHLYIVDYGNHRIVRQSRSHGFRCIIGCFGAGSAPDQLWDPRSMAFDSYGNIFVVDAANNRIQKFILIKDSCGEYSYVLTEEYAFLISVKLIFCRPDNVIDEHC